MEVGDVWRDTASISMKGKPVMVSVCSSYIITDDLYSTPTVFYTLPLLDPKEVTREISRGSQATVSAM